MQLFNKNTGLFIYIMTALILTAGNNCFAGVWGEKYGDGNLKSGTIFSPICAIMPTESINSGNFCSAEIGSFKDIRATTGDSTLARFSGHFRSRNTGMWNRNTSWEKFTNGFWMLAGPGEFPNSDTSDVEIRAGHVITLNANEVSVRNLIVDPLGQLYSNTNNNNKFIDIYGDLICNGIVGNAAIPDGISFNIEGTNCHLFGVGSFSCGRIRKNTGNNLTSTLTIDINVNTYSNNTALYNNYRRSPNAFNVIINSSFTCNNGGSVAIDGSTGVAFGNSYGTYTVNGTLTIPGTLYLTSNNASPYNCAFIIGPAGVVNAAAVSMAESRGTTTHSFSIASTGKLNITGTQGISPFSTTGNSYTLSPGSTVEYSASGAEPVESLLPYSNLTISGSGIKTANGNINVGNIFTLASGSFALPGLHLNMAANSTITGNGGNFSTGDSGGTVSFAGNGTINGSTALSFHNLDINAGIVNTVLNNCSALRLNLIGGTFNIGANNQFNMLTGGIVKSAAGDFSSGANGGILNFISGGEFIGTCNPYNVYTSGALDFGAGIVTIQNGGSFRINAGGLVNTNGPFYDTNSTLIYNTGSSFDAGAEWKEEFTSGRAIPYHVQIGTAAVSNTKLVFGSSNNFRHLNGDMFVGPSSGGTGYGLTLGMQPGGDLQLAGNWTRASTATFIHNTRSVKFNGISGNQTVAVLGGGTEAFASLIINKPVDQSLRLSASPATNISVEGGGSSNALQLEGGDLDLNRQQFYFAAYFNGKQNNMGIDGTADNLIRNVTSSSGNGEFIVTNSDAAPHFISIRRVSDNEAMLVFGHTVTVAVSTTGNGAGGSGIDFGNTLSTINGTLRIDPLGYVISNPPTYGDNSTLVYNLGAGFDRNVEWSSITGPGYPFHVTIQNNTNLRLNTSSANGDADRALAGNLSIAVGSGLLSGSSAGNTLTVGGSIQLDGELTLPTASGGDLYIGANWIRSATGVFTPNDQVVFFYGSGNSKISAAGGQLFPYLHLKKDALSNTLSLLDDISISKAFTVTSGTFALADHNATLKSNESGTASFGQVGEEGDVTYGTLGRFIVERYIPTGTLGGQHVKSWQLLATPANGGQSINAGWQEGNVLPSTGPSGLGTIISSNIPGAGFDIIGGAGPSMKTYDAASNNWIGVANTIPLELYNPKGYFIFVRGDRTVTVFNQDANPTTLRSTGKLFVPRSNPPPATIVPEGTFESIGNPYACAIDFLGITKPEAPAVDDAFYVWDPLLQGSSSLGGFQTISSANSYKPMPGGTANYDNAIPYTKIQSGQAFLVHATGKGGKVAFTENAKISGSDMVYRGTNPNPGRQYFRAQLYTSGGKMVDANVVAFDQSFENRYEANDALKIMNSGENFGIKNQEHSLTVEARSPVMGSDTVRYMLSNLRQAGYQLKFGAENMESTGITVWLEDQFLQTKKQLGLSDSSFVDFTITADPASAVADRFMLVLTKINSPASDLPVTINNEVRKAGAVKKDNESTISVYPNPIVDKTIQLVFSNKPAGNYRVQILNNKGQFVQEHRITVTGEYFTRSIRVSGVAAGYYRLMIIGEDGSSTIERVVIL